MLRKQFDDISLVFELFGVPEEMIEETLYWDFASGIIEDLVVSELEKSENNIIHLGKVLNDVGLYYSRRILAFSRLSRAFASEYRISSYMDDLLFLLHSSPDYKRFNPKKKRYIPPSYNMDVEQKQALFSWMRHKKPALVRRALARLELLSIESVDSLQKAPLNPEELLIEKELLTGVSGFTKNFPHKMKVTMEGRALETKTLDEISGLLGKTIGRVQQIEILGWEKLQHPRRMEEAFHGEITKRDILGLDIHDALGGQLTYLPGKRKLSEPTITGTTNFYKSA